MSEAEGEILVIGGRQQVAGSDRWPVVASVDPDILVVGARSGDLAEIAGYARLAMAHLPDGGVQVMGDEDALDELGEDARLFVAAWRRQPLTTQDRVGEGLSWDAPGFEPPDRPTG